LKRNAEELLTFILDVIGKIASVHQQDELLEALSKMCRDIVFAERCSIWIVDKRTQKLWTKIADGIDAIEIDLETGIVGNAIALNESLIINDVQNDARFHSKVDAETGYITKTMMVIPMVNQNNEVMGAIQVINKKEHDRFLKQDLKYLTLAASYAAESLETILLMEEIDQTQKELIYIMGVTGENRSKETGFHVKRVAEYSWLLAKLYGLPLKECDILRDVSPMHDIGKIGIQDAILNKPARLDDTEMEIMKTHARLGFDILHSSELPLLKAAATVAYEHHERFDGTGYPNKLQGNAIHIFGRITALADVFDALGSERVYKKAWDDKRIFNLFEEEKGRHFDPQLVELFMEHHKEFLEIRDRLTDV